MTVVFATAVVLLPLVFQRSFEKMFDDFGSHLHLPLVTRVALSPWFGVALAGPGLASLLVGLLTRRRVLLLMALVAALFGLVAGIPAFLGAMYFPIFQLANRVSAGPGTR